MLVKWPGDAVGNIEREKKAQAMIQNSNGAALRIQLNTAGHSAAPGSIGERVVILAVPTHLGDPGQVQAHLKAGEDGLTAQGSTPTGEATPVIQARLKTGENGLTAQGSTPTGEAALVTQVHLKAGEDGAVTQGSGRLTFANPVKLPTIRSAVQSLR